MMLNVYVAVQSTILYLNPHIISGEEHTNVNISHAISVSPVNIHSISFYLVDRLPKGGSQNPLIPPQKNGSESPYSNQPFHQPNLVVSH